MKKHEMNAAIAKSVGWRHDPFCVHEWTTPNGTTFYAPPPFSKCLNWMAKARDHHITTLELRIKWVNTLRRVVGREMPKNKVGVPLVTDVDLLFARPDQLAETLLRTINLWKE